MKYIKILIFTFISSITSLSFSNENHALFIIGNKPGENFFVSGPREIQIDMGKCQFSMKLGLIDHVQFNDPDLILYQSPNILQNKEIPRLVQAPMSMGYDWSFEPQKNTAVPWLGVMCENKSDFSWSLPSTEDSVPPQLQQIMEDNAEKCPADFDGKKWHPHTNDGFTRFTPIEGSNWSGFVVAYPAASDHTSIDRIKFCVISSDNVVIGISTKSKKSPFLSDDFFDYIIKVLLSLKFQSN